MRKQEERHIIDILFVAGLFCIFALSAIFLISIGANIYGKTVTNMEANFNERTAFAYITEKVRQADEEGRVLADTFEGIPSLKLTSTQNDTTYYTWIYEYEGYLKELLTRADVSLSPSAGQDILPIQDFSIEQISDQMLYFAITTSTEDHFDLLITLKSDQIVPEGGSYENELLKN